MQSHLRSPWLPSQTRLNRSYRRSTPSFRGLTDETVAPARTAPAPQLIPQRTGGSGPPPADRVTHSGTVALTGARARANVRRTRVRPACAGAPTASAPAIDAGAAKAQPKRSQTAPSQVGRGAPRSRQCRSRVVAARRWRSTMLLGWRRSWGGGSHVHRRVRGSHRRSAPSSMVVAGSAKRVTSSTTSAKEEGNRSSRCCFRRHANQRGCAISA